MNQRIIAILLWIIGVGASGASAATQLDVEIGWAGAYRAGFWTPIYITTSDDRPRNALIELYVPHDSINAMKINQVVTIGPQPATFVLYAPMPSGLEELSVQLRDPGSGRRLAEFVVDPYAMSTRPIATPSEQVIGISGLDGAHQVLVGHFRAAHVPATALDAVRLPAVPQGYDTLNVLLLNQPDLSRMSVDQQQAIADWVHAGGRLVIWPSATQQPPQGAIIDLLPAEIEENITLTIPSEALRDAGLADRFGQQRARRLVPRPGAEPIPLLGGQGIAYARRAGFGRVVLLPVDPSMYIFNTPSQAMKFWRPLLGDAVVFREPASPDTPDVYTPYADSTQQARWIAASQVMDRIGDVPGAGQFGFTYIAIILFALMLVVGPIDWIVLKRLGRQPWTWVTTSGWIGLVTLGAIYIGHTFNSGELHYNTLRLVDQIDNATRATIEAAAIYAPRTADYALEADRDGWWRPLSADAYFSRTGVKREIRFRQDYRGNRPESLRVNVWNLRFVYGESMLPGPALIDATLRMEKQGSTTHLSGSVTNLSSSPIGSITAYTSEGTLKLSSEPLAPMATVQVKAGLAANPHAGKPQYVYGPYGSVPVEPGGLPPLFNLADVRSARIRSLISSGDYVCIVAESQADAPQSALRETPERQKHEILIRALVQLEQPTP